MDKLWMPEPTAEEAAELEITLQQCVDEMRRLNELMRQDDVEIARLRAEGEVFAAESRAIGENIKAIAEETRAIAERSRAIGEESRAIGEESRAIGREIRALAQQTRAMIAGIGIP